MKRIITVITAVIVLSTTCLAQNIPPGDNATPTDTQGRPLPAHAPQLGPSETMEFPYGTNLEWCIRMSFAANGIPNPYTTPITGALVSRIKHISCYSPVPKVPEKMFDPDRNNSVRSLQGIEYFYNLETLVIDGTTEINDLYYLSGLEKLSKVDIKNSRITDITPLQYTLRMKRVILDNNSVTDLKPLAALKDLTELSLRYQGPDYVQDISPLAGKIVLTTLDLKGNKISDISSLANLYIRILNLQDNRLTSIEALRSVSTLESIDIGANQITDLSPLTSSLNTLQVINVAHNNITSLEFITGHMPRLTGLKVSDNQITDVSPIVRIDPRGIRRLELFLDQNNITDVMPLRELANLYKIHTLRLSYNCIPEPENIRFLHDPGRIPNVFIGYQCVDRPGYTEENTDSRVVNRDLVISAQN